MKFRSRITASAGLALLLASASFAQQTTNDSASDTGSTLSNANAAPEVFVPQTEDFVPMTRSERAAHYARAIIGPQAFVFSAAQAGINQLRNTPKEWQQGAEGYGRRYGSAYAEHIIGQTIENGAAFVLHEDNRYFRSEKTGFGRLGYAITSAFLARHDNGSRFISFSAFGGAAGSAFISRAWQPRSTTSMGDGATSFGINMGVRVGLNVAREFLPHRLSSFLR